MKSNAIVRIVIWSVVILVLLAVLIAGLGNNLFTVFHGSTDTVYHSTDVAASESPSGQSDTPIAERSVSVVSQTSVYTMPNTQSASVGALNVGDNVVVDRSEEVGGGSWIHITSPVDGWVNAECLKLNGVNQTGSVGSADPAAIREIKIEWISGSVTVEPGDVQEITFLESGNGTDKYEMVWKQSGDELVIQYSKDSSIAGFGLHFGDGSKDLTVTVPRGWVCDSLELDTASTDLTVRDMIIREMEIDSASGTAKFENCTVSSLDVDTASGDVTFSGSLNELDFEAASASFTGVLENVPNLIKMDSMSGDLTLTLPEGAGFTVSLDAMSSDFSSDFPTVKKNKSYVCGDGHCKIDVDAMSGDVSILKQSADAAVKK
ncbi:MAG: DUF4097 family beta strand repeat-containing protein [Oscillospiraceae bacterium]